ncbi:thiamine phosphate synthase [Novosphingobium sp.]|uniref:thiamine phosphate synthase n=1 Tax=Novosphingobium sp. TaxID=1874826 RepID=UPI00286DCB9D|nr:thiamine phosphate synthase [Novosphingobium sp.]
MARCYSVRVSKRYPSVPRLWLISDARNDGALEAALRRLPRGSGLVFRHYHLAEPERRARFRQVQRLARLRGHSVVLAGTMRQARRWGADGAYGSARQLAKGTAGLRLATVHSLRELRRAARADAVLLSPVFATRSHPGAGALGPLRFLLMAQKSRIPVLALGGMTPRRAARMPLHGWAAIDGLSP